MEEWSIGVLEYWSPGVLRFEVWKLVLGTWGLGTLVRARARNRIDPERTWLVGGLGIEV